MAGTLMQPDLPPHPALITALLNPAVYPHPAPSCQLIETHASWVILTGIYAYKIKKPVNLGFLDFSTLEKRRYCCMEEIRLNRRLAPDIYLAALPITGATDAPIWNGSGDAIEYAVQMIQFPQESQLDRVLEEDGLHPEQMDIMGRWLADFHHKTAVAASNTPYGDLNHVYAPVEENILQIRSYTSNRDYLDVILQLENWFLSAFKSLIPFFVQRKAKGFIRECHGDMHLRNIAWIHDVPVAFDCIEFNPYLRWIDVISDAAFLIMDLLRRNQARLAWRFLDRYVESGGDYTGLHILPYYMTYRALVRAKVDIIRAHQSPSDSQEQREAESDFLGYLKLAEFCSRPPEPLLIITHGLSASGKSTITQSLQEHLGAIRIRSDVERKRLTGVGVTAARSDIQAGIYTDDISAQTYQRLSELAAIIMDAGFPVIIDATCLKRSQRQQFVQIASSRHIPCVILDVTASPDVLRCRIKKRRNDVSDADTTVLEYQLQVNEPITDSEKPLTISVNTEYPIDIERLIEQIRARSSS